MSMTLQIILAVLMALNLIGMFMNARAAWGMSGAVALINLAAALVCWISITARNVH